MKNHIKEYKDRLEKKIGEYMEMTPTDSSARAIKGMMECWEMVDGMCAKDMPFTKEDADAWNAKMINDDGTTGGHWKVEQTTAVAESMGVVFEHISKWCWNVTMNMMYSDYCMVAKKYKCDTPDFYACMAKAFLFDPDGPTPNEKLSAYYHGIVAR